MWGSRTTRHDTAAAARRRLAAIAAEFDRGPGTTVGSPPASSPSPGVAPDLATAGSEGGRHRQRGPATMGGRWRLTAHHLVVVVLGVAVLVALAAWWALRSVPHEAPVPLATNTAVGTGTGAGSGTAGASSDAPASTAGTPPVSTPTGGVPAPQPTAAGLVVDVAGKVRRPGIVELPPGSRVVDALAAAGGARPGTDTAGLNLARPLVDGEQIVVGLEIPPGPVVATAPPAGGSPTAAPVSVNLNTADQTELEALPGIGPVTAQSILDWRAENGSFTSVDQLLDVSGIGDVTLADIEPYVHV